jgi:phosphoglycolate phosphatase-like HAD superfamily hydrolase
MKILNVVLSRIITLLLLLVLLGACAATRPEPATDPLPSWNAGDAKQSILAFVDNVTDLSGPDFIAAEDRIAVFDNDGTLWSEKPTYFQLLFILDRIRALSADHPEWRSQQPFQAVLENDMAALAATGEHGLVELAGAAQAGMTSEEYAGIVSAWIESARHPVSGKPYTSMVFQPMLELLDLLRDKGFRVYIVSGGGIDFMRPWTEGAYGIPPHDVIGSSQELRYEQRDSGPVLVREPRIHFINDKSGKPIGIQRFIGRRPVIAVGNSDGDYEMLDWTTSGEGPRLGLIVHHTDGEREWAYDRDSSEGRLDRALADAPSQGWTVIDMARDWRMVFPPAN